jgi:hypothetical protein
MRSLPDRDITLRDASDFVFESRLVRRALLDPTPPSLAVFLRELLTVIHRLTVSCHLPEFTDHGLNHLCSLIDRLSQWSSPSQRNSDTVVDCLSNSESAVLLLAILFHDIGMLSQRPEDLPRSQPQWNTKGVRDIPNWVRATHILRMEPLVRRLFDTSPFVALLDEDVPRRAFAVARAHGKWPWDWSGFNFTERDAGLAALLAVADLLDEDSNRCDTATLLRHRSGSHLNCAHWLRHGLTHGRVLIEKGELKVELRRPPDSDSQLASVYRALRNHFRLAFLYAQELGQVNAGILNLIVSPATGCPTLEEPILTDWSKLPGFASQSALEFHLLNSFLPEALIDVKRIDKSTVVRLISLGFENVDLENYHRIRGILEIHSYEEQAFHALLGTGD